MGKRNKRGRPATGQAPAIAIRLPSGWLKQIDRLGAATDQTRSKVARALIGAALAARKVKSGLETKIERIDIETARAFAELWHYTGNLPQGRNVCFGWFVEGELYAVACYGDGINQIQHEYLSRVTGLPIKRKTLFELRRLCRTEPARDGFPLSKFIAGCHRLLKQEHGIRFIVSFSDPAYNRFKKRRKGVPYESGGIYAASNFKHLGKTRAEWHVIDGKGKIQHHRKPYHFMFQTNGDDRKKWKRGAITIAEARKRLGLKLQRTRAKDRWFLDLGV